MKQTNSHLVQVAVLVALRVVTVLLSAARVMLAAEQALDFVRFSPPQGWTVRSVNSEGRVLSPPQGDGSAATIVVSVPSGSSQTKDLA